MSKFGRRGKRPDGFEAIESILDALEVELREKVNEPHEGLRKHESSWPVHQINWQRSRYVYDMYYKYNRISRDVYEYCVNNKLVDAALIAKWKKNGYEKLCSTYTINPKNFKFGTVAMCRVPASSLAPGTQVENPITGCRGCASGSGIDNIFGNKYGQYLADIQMAREERAMQQQQAVGDGDEGTPYGYGDDEGGIQDEGDYVTAADGSSGGRGPAVWNGSSFVYATQGGDGSTDEQCDDTHYSESTQASKRTRTE